MVFSIVAVLMPSLQRTRDQAKTVVCQTQLKQWGIVFSMYTGDNNGYFHRGHQGSGDFKGNWFNATMGYWKDPAILRCPMAKIQKGGPQRGDGGKFMAWGNWLGNQDTIVAGAYAINGWVQNPPPGENTKGHDSRNNWRTFYAKTASGSKHQSMNPAGGLPLRTTPLTYCRGPGTYALFHFFINI